MIYIYYKFNGKFKGWNVRNSKLKCRDYCGKSLLLAIRIYLWHMGVPASKALNFLRKNKFEKTI